MTSERYNYLMSNRNNLTVCLTTKEYRDGWRWSWKKETGEPILVRELFRKGVV